MIAITQEKKRKYTHIGRKEVELSLYADYKILHIEYPIDYIRTLLKRISKLNEVAGYKVNIQNLLHFSTLTMKYQKGNVKKYLLK